MVFKVLLPDHAIDQEKFSEIIQQIHHALESINSGTALRGCLSTELTN